MNYLNEKGRRRYFACAALGLIPALAAAISPAPTPTNGPYVYWSYGTYPYGTYNGLYPSESQLVAAWNDELNGTSPQLCPFQYEYILPEGNWEPTPNPTFPGEVGAQRRFYQSWVKSVFNGCQPELGPSSEPAPNPMYRYMPYICPPGWQVVTIYGPPATCEPLFSASLDDPIADQLVSGKSIVDNTTTLLAATHTVFGTTADNATQILVSVGGAAANPGDLIQFTLSNENGPSADGNGSGYLTGLGGEGDSRTSGGVIALNAVASTGDTAWAFAVYHAPTDFARAGNISDQQATLRYVTIQILDVATRQSAVKSVAVVRPPVVLIHGLWGAPNDFIGPPNGVYATLTAGAPQFTVSFAAFNTPILVEASNPSYGNQFITNTNSFGFLYNANTVLPQIEYAIAQYKEVNPSGSPIAATQADIVGHSMGGDITRTLPQLPTYADQNTYGIGYVHKLITIDTPHWGSPLAAEILDPNENNACLISIFRMAGHYAFRTVELTSGGVFNGAVGDLQTGSGAVQAIHQGNPIIPTAMIGGQMDAAQIASAGTGKGRVLKTLCLTNPLASKLNPSGWTTLMGGPSDAIVPLNSQFDVLGMAIPSGSNLFTGIHSTGAEYFGFPEPTVLESASMVPEDVVTLLNTPVSNTSVFIPKP